MKDTYDRVKGAAEDLERIAADLRERADKLAQHAAVLREIRKAVDAPEAVTDSHYANLTPGGVAAHLATVARDVVATVARQSSLDFLVYELTDGAAQFAMQAGA